MKKTCPHCGGNITSRTGTHQYTECGLDNVHLLGVELLQCDSCGDTGVSLPNIAGLHGEIARILATKKARLVPAEIRFLRSYLGHARDDFANLLMESYDTVCAWETGSKPLTVETELRIRWMALQHEPVKNYTDKNVASAASLKAAPTAVRLRKHDHSWLSEATV